jgi:hypothetical protein
MWALAAAFYLVAIFHRMSLGVASLDASERFGHPQRRGALTSVALLPLLALALWGAVQVTRHASLRPLWSSSRA